MEYKDWSELAWSCL